MIEWKPIIKLNRNLIKIISIFSSYINEETTKTSKETEHKVKTNDR